MQVFHVFHSFCLIEWIAFCEAKAWSASFAVKGNKKPRKVKQTGGCQPVDSVASQDNGGAKTEIGEGRGIFCPECQGTGVKLKGGQLERPRFRLAQVICLKIFGLCKTATFFRCYERAIFLL